MAALHIDVETSDAPQASVTTSLSAGNIVTEVPAGVASGVPGAMQEQTAGGEALDETSATVGSSPANQRKKARRQGLKAKLAEQARAAEEAEMAKVRAEAAEAAAIMAARRAASVARAQTSEVRLNAAAASSEAVPHQAESGRAAADDAGAEAGV